MKARFIGCLLGGARLVFGGCSASGVTRTGPVAATIVLPILATRGRTRRKVGRSQCLIFVRVRFGWVFLVSVPISSAAEPTLP